MEPVITVCHLSKKYKIGFKQPYYSLRDTFVSILKQPQTVLKGESKGSLAQDEIWALQDVSFGVNKGEVLGIIGKNGAGKSTLLKILARITMPSRGEVKLKGRVASLLEVGTGFHPELTGRENVYLNGAILGMTRKEITGKFDEIVAFAEVEKFIDTPVKKYSSGMYMRLAFAVAAHLNPEILVIDEVLAVGDAQFQQKCLGKMQKTTQEGRTVLFVSHNMGAVSQICDSCIVLDAGKIVYAGDTDKAIRFYLKHVETHVDSSSREYPLREKKEGQILSVKLVDESGKQTNKFRVFEKGYAIIKYQLRKTLQNCNVTLTISRDGERIWTNHDTESQPGLWKGRKADAYEKIVSLPIHFLTPGNYNLGPSMGYAGVGPIDRHFDDGIIFEVLNISESEIKPDYFKGYGTICYIKPWQDYRKISPK